MQIQIRPSLLIGKPCPVKPSFYFGSICSQKLNEKWCTILFLSKNDKSFFIVKHLEFGFIFLENLTKAKSWLIICKTLKLVVIATLKLSSITNWWFKWKIKTFKTDHSNKLYNGHLRRAVEFISNLYNVTFTKN